MKMTMAFISTVIVLVFITEASTFTDLIPNMKCLVNNIQCCRGYTCKSWGDIGPLCVKDNFRCNEFFDWGDTHSGFTSGLQSSGSLQTCNPSADSDYFGDSSCDVLAKCCRVKGRGWWDDIFGGKKGVCVTPPSYNPCPRYQTRNCVCPNKWDSGWMNKHEYGWDWLLDILD